jgi:hypothetical protein
VKYRIVGSGRALFDPTDKECKAHHYMLKVARTHCFFSYLGHKISQGVETSASDGEGDIWVGVKILLISTGYGQTGHCVQGL